jgi:hypothetical protein
MFNVGEVVVMPDGQVKSKDAIKKAAEMKAQREIEAAVEKAENIRITAEKAKYKEEKLQAKRDGREPPPRPSFAPATNLQGAASFYGGGEVANKNQQPKVSRLSKKQQRRIEMLKPKPVPPKPVIPEGISLPEGEEDLLALWDITDEEIQRRLKVKKKEKIQAGKNLRKIQKEQKKFNRAMKVRKKQAANAGVLWDPEKAKKEILGEMEKADWGDDDSNSESESDSDSEDKANGKKESKTSSGNNEDSDSDSSSDSDSDSNPDTDSEAETGKEAPKKKKGMPQVNRPRLNLELLEQAARIKQELEDKKRNARLRRRAERREAAAELARIATEQEERAKKLREEENAGKEKSSKKRKRSKDDEPEQNGKKIKSEDVELSEEAKRKLEKERKERKEKRRMERAAKELGAESMKVDSRDDKLDQAIAEREAQLKAKNEDAEEGPRYEKVAQQWNPDALNGDKERKAKFLRLLGGGKQKETETEDQKEREKNEKIARKAARKAERSAAENVKQIAKMESDLEKQYEAGMKLKHEGGGHRRGLGA